MPKLIEKFFSLKDLWKNIDKLPSSRKYLAGGTDIVVAYNLGFNENDCWIDISDIKELKEIKKIGNEIFIGSAVKISELEKSPLVKKYFPALIETIPYYASPSLRNMATLGGNYVNASPSADGICALAATRAKAVLNLKGKKRILPILSILKGPKKIDLKKDELVEGFLIPIWRHKALFFKMMPRKNSGIARASLCMCYEMKGKILNDLNIALGSVGPVIICPQKTISYLKGKNIDEKLITEACQIIKTEISPITDIRSEAEYRREIISVFLKRALLSI